MEAKERPLSPYKKQRPQQKNQYVQNTPSHAMSQSVLDAIAGTLGKGREIKNGEGWLTCCPVHGDEKPSLAITLNDKGGLIVNCHAGCDWRAVKDELRARRLLSGNTSVKRQSKASFVWSKCSKDDDKIRRYFTSRNIELDQIPECLRWNLYKGKEMMVARVKQPGDKTVQAIHRTYINGKFQRTDKKMLGPCKGRSAWLAEPQKKMLVGEGIETTLSAMTATGIPSFACLSASGMKAVEIPASVREIIILVDSDPNHVGQNAAMELAKRFQGTAYFATPCDSCLTDHPDKLDFNDLDPEKICKRFEQLIDINEIIEPDEQPEVSLFDENGKPKTKGTVLIEIGS